MEVRAMGRKSERVELETKIVKCRALAGDAVSDDVTKPRIADLAAELEQKLRELDAQGPLSSGRRETYNWGRP